MVLDLTLRSWLVLLFAPRICRLDLFLPARRIQNGLCAGARRPNTASLILELSCVYSPGKPLAGLSPLALLPAMGTNAHRFLLANSQGKPTESQCSGFKHVAG
jgi:hypothetical protein